MKDRAMRTVELDDDAPQTPPGPDPAAEDVHARPSRTLRWVLAGTATVLVVAAGTTQWVLDARDRAAAAQLAAIAGVVPSIDGPLHISPRYKPTDAAVFFEQQGGQLVRSRDGSLTYTWTGSGDGWTTQLLGPTPALAGGLDVLTTSVCVPNSPPGEGPSTATRLACLITDGATNFSFEGTAEHIPATAASIELLDTADGTRLAHWPAPTTTTTLALLGELVVLGTTQTSSDTFTSYDALTGEQRWTHQVPVDENQFPDRTSRSIDASAAGDLFALRISSSELQLLTAEGEVARDALGGDDGTFWSWRVDRAGRYLLESSDAYPSTLLLSADFDPDKDHTLEGGLVNVTVDDRSDPSLVLTADAELHAWDADTGAERWTSTAITPVAPGAPTPPALIIRGRVYVLGQTGLTALDAQSGKTVWHVPPGNGQLPLELMTDAHHLAVAYEYATNSERPHLVTYTFDDGTEVGHVRYPDEIDHLVYQDGKLYGFDVQTTKVSLLE